MMTKTLQNAFEEASKLPETEQEELAAWLLDELRSEKHWGLILKDSDETLKQLSEEALLEYGKSETEACNYFSKYSCILT